MRDSKPCRTCGNDRPIGEFKKLPPLMVERSGSRLTHGHDCKACRLKIKAKRALEKAGVEPPEEVEDVSAEPSSNPTLAVPMAMPVDVEWDGCDFVLTQDNDGTTHTVYVAPHTLRRVWEFAESLAQQQAAQQQAPSAA